LNLIYAAAAVRGDSAPAAVATLGSNASASAASSATSSVSRAESEWYFCASKKRRKLVVDVSDTSECGDVDTSMEAGGDAAMESAPGGDASAPASSSAAAGTRLSFDLSACMLA
jgi:hypothetical protein